MPQYETVTIRGTTTYTPSGLESYIKDAKLSREDAQALRIEHQRELFRLRREEAKETYPELSSGGTLTSALANFGNQAIPGAAATGLSALTAPVTAYQRGIGLKDAYSLNRDLVDQALNSDQVGKTVGTVAAFVAPTPISKVAQFGARAAGAEKLAKIAANAPTVTRSVVAQIMSGVAAGGGATLASELASVPGQVLGGEGILDSVRFAIRSSAQGAVMGGALGGAIGLARKPADEATKKTLDLIKRAKASRILKQDFTPTPDMLRDPEGAMGGVVDTLGRSVTGRRQLQGWLTDHFYKPLQDWMALVKHNVGASRSVANDTAVGAGGVRELLEGPTSLAARRARIGRQALGGTRARGIPVADAGAVRINRLMDALDRRAQTMGASVPNRGGRLSKLFQDTRNVLRNNPNVAQLEELRQRIQPIANFDKAIPGSPVFSNRDVREAKMMYRAVREAMRRSDSTVDFAIRDMAQLRQAERSLREIVKTTNLGDDKQLADAVFTAANFRARWGVLEKTLPQERLQALRGAYLADFIDDIAVRRGTAVNPKDALNWRAMHEKLNGKDKFRLEVFDSVLGPDVRADLEDAAQISDLVLRTVGRAEGSQTAGREATARALEAGTDMISSAGDPGLMKMAGNRVLGLAGLAAFYSGLLNGRMAQFMNTMATGGTVTAGQRAIPAMQAAGGPLAVAQAGGQLVGGAAQGVLGGGLSALGSLTSESR